MVLLSMAATICHSPCPPNATHQSIVGLRPCALRQPRATAAGTAVVMSCTAVHTWSSTQPPRSTALMKALMACTASGERMLRRNSHE